MTASTLLMRNAISDDPVGAHALRPKELLLGPAVGHFLESDRSERGARTDSGPNHDSVPHYGCNISRERSGQRSLFTRSPFEKRAAPECG